MSATYVPNPSKALIEMPLGLLVVERKYSARTTADDPAFKQDSEYFRSRKDRWITIRKATVGEFDNLEATFWLHGELVQPPQAWVRVTRHPTLGFRAVMVWRGELHNVPHDAQGYLTLESDDATEFILHSMTVQGCANWPEIETYYVKHRRAIMQQSAGDGSGKVH